MISLYFHIPFCYKKCNYCNFYIIPTNNIPNIDEYKDLYLEALKNDINFQLERFNIQNAKVKTIYFWWWTPSELWINRLKDLINLLSKKFDLSNIEEFSFEINPLLSNNKPNDTLKFIDEISKLFYWKSRISIWIQSLNNELLAFSWRNYEIDTINYLLNNLKANNIVINLDFISFWLEKFFDNNYFGVFDNFVKKYYDKIDSYSIYTLELYPWSIFWNNEKLKKLINFKWNIEKNILENFKKYLFILEKNKYLRYEISNFSKKNKYSKHNVVYWNMEPYLWFWVSASWYVSNNFTNSKFWIRYTNSFSIQKYLKNQFEFQEYKELEYVEYLQEKVFLWLRQTKWIKLTKEIKQVLNITKLNQLVNDGFLHYKNKAISFTKKWFDVYNYIVTEILEF